MSKKPEYYIGTGVVVKKHPDGRLEKADVTPVGVHEFTSLAHLNVEEELDQQEFHDEAESYIDSRILGTIQSIIKATYPTGISGIATKVYPSFEWINEVPGETKIKMAHDLHKIWDGHEHEDEAYNWLKLNLIDKALKMELILDE